MQSKEFWIKRLNLEPHPEGGYFKEVYRSEGIISQNCLPNQYNTQRNFATSIYFLLGHKNISAFHRLKSDEIWYYHAGEPLKVFIINKKGELEIKKLGTNIDHGEELQIIIPAGSIFGAKVISNNNYTLMGCMVAPGFDFSDFELMDQASLIKDYPEHAETIKMLTKQ